MWVAKKCRNCYHYSTLMALRTTYPWTVYQEHAAILKHDGTIVVQLEVLKAQVNPVTRNVGRHVSILNHIIKKTYKVSSVTSELYNTPSN